MILTHESWAQEDQFDEKKWRPKISWYYPFKEHRLVNTSNLVCEKNLCLGSTRSSNRGGI